MTFDELAELAACNNVVVERIDSGGEGGSAGNGDGTGVDRLSRFRQDLRDVCSDPEEGADTDAGARPKRMIASFSRAVLQQTGSGHFSPIGAWEPESDMALVMDVARFKYSPFWAPVEMLHDAMCTTDETCGESRGYLLISKAEDQTGAQVNTCAGASGCACAA